MENITNAENITIAENNITGNEILRNIFKNSNELEMQEKTESPEDNSAITNTITDTSTPDTKLCSLNDITTIGNQRI